MYADVVVLTYQAPDIGSFTYEIPKNLEKQAKIGQLVQVPFGNRKPLGVVIALHNRHPRESEDQTFVPRTQSRGILDQVFDRESQTESVENDTKTIIKSISEIVFPNPLLLPYQLNLLQWMSSYYFAPMVNCLEAMLPQLPANLFKYSSSGAQRNREVSSGSKFSTLRQAQGSNNSQEISQTLVLVPTITRIPQIMPLFKNAKNYIFYHNQLKSTERFTNWLKILEGNVDYVFGSRSAIFSPCPKLSKIIIFDEHDGAYKDERSPYFDTLTIAEKLVELTAAKLEIADSSPKITTYFVHRNEIASCRYSSSERSESRSLSTLSSRPKGSRQARTIPKVKIVSMADERQAGNKLPISSALSEKINRIHKANGKILLFLNKKAESGQIYCRACKQQNFAPKMPVMCPHCQSPDIFFHSLNINSLAGEVKKVVPQSNLRFLAEGINTKYQIPNTEYRIDIATSVIFYTQVFQKYDLVAHILTDTVLNIADLKTSEKLYSQISDLKKLTRDSGLLILQTYNPESELIKNAARGDFKNFYLTELNARKMLLYPPLSLLIKLTIKGKNKDLIFQKAKDLVETLKAVHGSTIKPPNPIILGPYESVFLGKTPRYNTILKVKLNSYDIKSKEKAAKSLLPYILKVPKGWQITVEPDSLN